MITVYKYPIEEPPSGIITFRMPEGAQILHVQVQHGTPCLWALVDTEKEQVSRNFIITGTGHKIPEKFNRVFHHGSFFLAEGALVFHIFEVL